MQNTTRAIFVHSRQAAVSRSKKDHSQLTGGRYHLNMHPKKISIADYSYHLPEELIAHYPLAERDASKLLIYDKGEIKEDIYRHIADHLPANSLLVFNNTRVVEARILFRKPTGAQIELFCLEPPPEYAGITTAMQQQGKVRWKCLIGGASKWKAGQILTRTITPKATEQRPTPQPSEPITLEARYLDKLQDSFLIELSWKPAHLSFAELLHQAGLIPLPPYIRRAAEESDSERYQTIYARHDGSVAAPTAGLHFTETIFQTLSAKNIQREFVTLHVGAGTFLPVKAATMEQHFMHVEYISITPATIKSLLTSLGGHIIPVGTTSARTLESLYWLGVKALRNPALLPGDLSVQQWDAYGGDGTGIPKDDEWPCETEAVGEGNSGTGDAGISGISPEKALTALLTWMERQGLPQLLTKTQLLITPGYDWKIASGLITNFHQPESTLLLLVASLIGKDWRKVYDYALQHRFRFLSYGDGSLLLR